MWQPGLLSLSPGNLATMMEQPAPYGTDMRRPVRTANFARWKASGRKWSMLTAYDFFTAQIFDEAGVDCLLIGDSAGNNVLGYDTTVPVTVDELLPMVRAVSRGAERAFVLADLPFGSYQESPQQALATAVRFLKEGGAHGVKLEGGEHMADTVRLLAQSGIPVMAHIGFTPQSVHALGGYRVQGRGDAAARMLHEAHVLEDAGAFAVLMEMVPAPAAARITNELSVPTVGIGAGAGTDAQVLVWQDALGLREGKMPRFVKQYANLRATMISATQEYVSDVQSGTFPAEQHSFTE